MKYDCNAYIFVDESPTTELHRINIKYFYRINRNDGMMLTSDSEDWVEWSNHVPSGVFREGIESAFDTLEECFNWITEEWAHMSKQFINRMEWEILTETKIIRDTHRVKVFLKGASLNIVDNEEKD